MNTFCTIITPDYLHFALSTLASIEQCMPNARMQILIAGDQSLDDNDAQIDGAVMLPLEEVVSDSAVGKQILEKYGDKDMDALRWSLKPVLINHLLNNEFEKVIYVDCDIFFFKSPQFLFDELDQSDVLLTPHWRCSRPEEDFKDFVRHYTHGLFNGGFVGCNRNGMEAMNWWAEACAYVCKVQKSKGLFVDQSHLGMLPVMFEKVKILKHRGCNVANWNQVECKRTSVGEEVLINQRDPVVFIHFTGDTIRGILDGTDGLLRPHLHQYADTVKSLKPDLDIEERYARRKNFLSRFFNY